MILSSYDEQLIDELMKEIEQSIHLGEGQKQTLISPRTDGPSIMTPERRLNELQKLRDGQKSEWAEEELKAIKRYKEIGDTLP